MQKKLMESTSKIISEGKAKIKYIQETVKKGEGDMIKTAKGNVKKANEINSNVGTVFYNPIQEFNRDISILTINEYAKLKRVERESSKV
jgi:tRNA G26 N,N-dimethylase Trm1